MPTCDLQATSLVDQRDSAADSAALIDALGIPGGDLYHLPTSTKRFPDGTSARIEIPSVEGPAAFTAVLDEAKQRKVPVHRVSQGSGISMLTDEELKEFATLGRQAGVEVSLFVGPRAGWGTGIQVSSSSGRVALGALRGADQLRHATDDVLRAAEVGVGSVLVADLGQLMVLGRLKEAGHLPADFVLKVSVSLPCANPATARVMEDLGAGSLNLPVDLSLPALAAIRAAVDVPVDLYIEAPEDFGGVVRYHEIPDIVRVTAPVYLKFTVRNAPHTYPSGQHLQSTVLSLSRERVRRAQLGLAQLERHMPGAVPA